MLHAEFSPSVRRSVLAALQFLAVLTSTCAQGSTDYVPGKLYMIRISATCAQRGDLESTLRPALFAQMSEGDGLMDHVTGHLFAAKSAQDGAWFIAYFNVQRQTKEELMRDMDLFTWFFHGHNVQIYPIEFAESPIRSIAADRTDH